MNERKPHNGMPGKVKSKIIRNISQAVKKQTNKTKQTKNKTQTGMVGLK